MSNHLLHSCQSHAKAPSHRYLQALALSHPFSVAPFSGAAPRIVHSAHDHLLSSNPYVEVSSSGAPGGNGHLETSLLTPQHVPSWVRLTLAKLLTPPFPAFWEPLPPSAALDQHPPPPQPSMTLHPLLVGHLQSSPLHPLPPLQGSHPPVPAPVPSPLPWAGGSCCSRPAPGCPSFVQLEIPP